MFIKRLFLLILLSSIVTLSGIAQVSEHLGYQINSSYEEREPIFSPDGRTLYFWRRGMPANTGGLTDPGDIWYSKVLGDGTFAPAIRMQRPLNSPGHDFIFNISTNNDTIWLHQAASAVSSDGLSYTFKDESGNWIRPRRAYIDGFEYKGNYKDFFLSKDKIMLIPNEGENSNGGTDLYVCFPLTETTWSSPVNLGPVINSPGDDDAPYLMADGKTLFFNSNGHGGFGEHDVFMSRRLDDTWQNWSEPVNLGAPVNTSSYDFDFIISPDEKYAYWGSDVASYGDNDILRLDLTECELDLYPEGDITLCEGEVAVLEGGFTYSSSTIDYQWYKDGRRMEGYNERRLEIREAGEYQLVRIKEGCTSASKPKRIKVNTLPEVRLFKPGEVLCLGDSVRLRAFSGSDNATYQWKKNGLNIPDANNEIYQVKSPGTYSVTVSNGNCVVSSEEVSALRFDSPSIYFARDTNISARLGVPTWNWANRIDEKKNRKLKVVDVAAGDDDNVFLMYLETDKRGRTSERIVQYYPRGPLRFEGPELKTDDLGARYMVVDPEGNLLVTRNEIYLTKYRADGSMLWQIDESRGKVTGLASDDIGNIYTLGRYKDSIAFSGQILAPTLRGSMYLAKHKPNGDLEWLRTFSVDEFKYDYGNGLHTDCNGNVYLGGGFKSIANFRNEILRAYPRQISNFLAKYDKDGNFKWAKKIATDKVDLNTYDLHTDCEGNTWLLASYRILKYNQHGQLVQDEALRTPGTPHTVRLVSRKKELFLFGLNAEKEEFFLSKLDRANDQVLIWQAKGAEIEEDVFPVISSDASGNLYVAARTRRDLPPGKPLTVGQETGIFVAKYGKRVPEKRVDPVSLCEGNENSLELLVSGEPGINYQWIKDGEDIPGANLNSLVVTKPGEYQVRTASIGCDLLSPIQEILDCDQEIPAPVPQIVEAEPKPEPQPEIANTTPELEPDLQRAPDGKPKKIKGRKVKSQGEVGIRQGKVRLTLFDYGAFDRDTVSLNVNGKWVLENYCLRKEGITLDFDFQRGEQNFIILYAHNLGTTPPNTASLRVDDGFETKTIKLESNLKKCGTLNLTFE